MRFARTRCIQWLAITNLGMLATIARADGVTPPAPSPTVFVELDADHDGVADYDDFCPRTPAGSKVWTKAQVEQNHGHADWAGCAGGPDSAAPGFVPPARPAQPTFYEKVNGLYNGGTIPTADNLSGVSLGRCFAANAPNAPMNKAVFLQGALVLAPEGPITGDVLAFSVYFIRKLSYNDLDAVDSVSGLENAIGDQLDADSDLPAARLKDGNLVAETKSDGTSIQNSLKLNGEYLVVKHTESSSSSPTYCYFYKKIMNP